MAHADDCANLPHVVYVSGSTAAGTFAGKLAAALQGLSTPINLVYLGTGSCEGVKNMIATPTTITGPAQTFDSTGAATAAGCQLDTAGQAVDIGVSDVWPTTCGQTLATDVKEFQGPIQSMNFVVPKDSTANAISYEAAHMLVGFDAATYPIAPWTDQTVLEVRKNTSGTLLMIGATIGVDGVTNLWKGNQNSGGTAVATAVGTTDVAAGKTQQAIGILSSGDADKTANAALVRKLAYQHKGQDCGYTVDSDSNAGSHDKRNVRDGHYYIWGPLHLMAHVGANGEPANQDVATVLDIIRGKVTNPALDLIQVEAKASVIPECAMRVYRSQEAGALSSYMPVHSCSCKWENEANGTPSNCTPCTAATVATDCKKGTMTQDGPITADAGGVCNYGFCEVQ
jgi:hypothetical protein